MASADGDSICVFQRSSGVEDPLSKVPTEIDAAFAQFKLKTISVDLKNAYRPAKITMENSQNNKTFSLTICCDSDGGWHADANYVRWDFVKSDGIAVVIVLDNNNELVFDKQSNWTDVKNGLTDMLNLDPECSDFFQLAVPYRHAVWIWQLRQFVENKILASNIDSKHWRKLRQLLTRVCRFFE